MSLRDLIYPNRKQPLATATPATHGAGNGRTVARVAVAKSPGVEAENVSQVVPADCVGALQSADGGLYLPWGPRLSPENVRRMRTELVELIEGLADCEGWSHARRDEVLGRAIRGPLSDLLSNLAHFRDRVIVVAAEYQASEALVDDARRAGANLVNRKL